MAAPLLMALLGAPALALPADLARQLGPDAAAPLVTVEPVGRKAPLAQADADKEGAVRYAVARPVSVDLTRRAAWQALPDGRSVGRLRVGAAGARNLSVAFERAELPPGAELWLHAASGRHALDRPLTAAHARSGRLWTPVVPGDEAVLSVVLPAGAPAPVLQLTRIHVGFRDVGEVRLLQGSCNIDTICPEGDAWREEIGSVAVYGMGGEFWCTGFMLNNTSGDQTPLFATANHCGVRSSNDDSLVVYWNYESATCGALSGGVADDWQVGSTFRMRASDPDWTLVELYDAPDPAWNVSWAGWDRSGAAPSSAVAIHHPGTDEKAISFEDDATRITWPYYGSADSDGTHIRIIDWDGGTTEGGSSGSPLFDQDHRAVGVLTGGDAACGNDDSDWYGRLYSAWDAGGSSSSRLEPWLDPTGTGDLTTDTLAPWATGVTFTDADAWRPEGPEGGPFRPAEAVITARNRDDEPRSVRATASADWIAVAAITPVPADDAAEITLSLGEGAAALPLGAYEATVTLTHDGVGAELTEVPVRLVVGDAELRYAWDLDEDPGWETEGDWAWGEPQGRGGSDGSPDPTRGVTGTTVYGYNLNGDYADYMGERDLTTPPLDFTNMAGAQLSFHRWLGVEESAYDHARISVSTDGSTWTTVWENETEVDDGRWLPVTLDLPAAVDGQPEVWLRWTMGTTDESVRYCGWNLDDIEITGVPTGAWPEEPVEPGPDTGDSGEPEPEAEDTGGDPTLDPNDPRNKDGGGELSSCGGCAAGAPAGGALSALTLGVLALAGRRRKH